LLLNQISKIDAGQIDLLISKIYIQKEINTLYHFFLPETTNTNVDLILEYKNIDTNSVFYSDLPKFQSILSNLIKNAIKFTNEGYIKINIQLQNERLIVLITDTGIGIPKDRIHAIFNRFEQADINDTGATQGSGLGLSIIKSYIDLLNGKISVNSTKDNNLKNSGTSFNLELPSQIANSNLIPTSKT
jgi:signal transduction histidine kinase